MEDKSAASVPGPDDAVTSNAAVAAAADNQPNNLSIRMVVQRYRRASILLEESRVVTVGESSMEESSLSRVGIESLLLNPGAAATDESKTTTSSTSSLGMLVYISFSKSATPDLVEQAAKTILNLPIQTMGAWGDGSGTKSMLQLLKARHESLKTSAPDEQPTESPVSIILVPQANLIAKVKKNGKSVQYHDQIEKSQGEKLYNLFCHQVETLLLDHQTSLRNGTSGNKPNANKPTTPDPSIPPMDLFRNNPKHAAEYGTFDGAGIPLTLSTGEPLSKSAKKKLQKIYDAHVRRHEKWLTKQQAKEGDTATANEKSKTTATSQAKDDTPKLEDSFVRLIKGTFGKRQGLELVSDMGPFCHVIEI